MLALLGRIPARLRQVAPAALAGCVVAYFLYHTVQGENGVASYRSLSARVAEAERARDSLRTARMALERRVALLQPPDIDRDMLEEAALRMLYFMSPEDRVLILPKE